MNAYITLLIILSWIGLSACAPEVGSAKWCEQLEEKPKGDWTAEDAGHYAKHCIFGVEPE